MLTKRGSPMFLSSRKFSANGTGMGGRGSYAGIDSWVLNASGVEATLDMDFVNGVAWNAGTESSIASLLACSRASTGYYTKADGSLTSFSNNVLRFGSNGLLSEESRTNVVLWNRDLTNVAWTKTNCTAALDQTGNDGTANGASSLVATLANATCLQAITLGSSARFQSCWIKRITGSGTINMTMDNGATWTAVTVTNNWTQVTIPTQTIANPTVGFQIVTNADKIAIDFVQNENGTRVTSPIATTTASVTRSADVITFNDLTWFDGTATTIYAQWIAANINGAEVWALDATNDVHLTETTGMSPKLADAGATFAITTGNTASAGSVVKAAGHMATNDIAFCMNAGTVGTDASATQPGTLTASRLGVDLAGANSLNSYILRVAAFKSTLVNNAGLQRLTT